MSSRDTVVVLAREKAESAQVLSEPIFHYVMRTQEHLDSDWIEVSGASPKEGRPVIRLRK